MRRYLPKAQQAAYNLAQAEKKAGTLKVLTGLLLIPNLATRWIAWQKFVAPVPPAPFLLLSGFFACINRFQLSPEARKLSSTFGDEEETHQQVVATRLM